MRTSFSFKSDESSSAPFIFGADSHGFNQIIIDGRWLYRDFRSKSPSYHLSKILQLSSVCITTADEKESLFYIDKNKCDIEKKYIGQIGVFLKTTQNNILFLSNSLRENSVVEIYFEIETSKERDAELIIAIEDYKEKNKRIKFEEAIDEYYIKSTAFRSISSEAST